MAFQTYTIKNLSNSVATITRFVFTDQSGVNHEIDFSGWNSPWGPSPGDYDTVNDTRRSESVVYLGDVRSIDATYVDSTGTTLIIDSTAGIQPGWLLDGEGYTAGQTVVSITSATWMVTSAGTDTSFVSDFQISFTPPALYMLVDDNTGVQIGWTAEGNGYSGQVALSTSGTNWIEMSAEPGGSSVYGSTVIFYSNDDIMATIGPGAEQTFLLDYTNSTVTVGNYTGDIQIYADVGGATVKNVNNIITLSPTPSDPSSPYYDGGSGGSFDSGGGGFDFGGGGDFGFAGLQGSQGFDNDASAGGFGDTAFA